MWVSTETIYQSLYVQSRGALRRDLARCLRTGRALRVPNRQGAQRKNRVLHDMINISGTAGGNGPAHKPCRRGCARGRR